MIAVTLIAACSWASPGAHAYQGRPAAAVERYADIPADVRGRLRARMERRQFDDVAAITRDSIQGKHSYTDLRDMHFGKATVCGRPDRRAWTDAMVERGLVYCEAEHCIIVPTVCRNVSRVTRVPAAAPPSEPAGPGMRGTLPELTFDAPGAGPVLVPVDVPQAAPTFQTASAPPAAVAPRADWLPLSAIAPPAIQPWAGPTVWAPVPHIPEPSTVLLLAVGVAVLLLLWKARRP